MRFGVTGILRPSGFLLLGSLSVPVPLSGFENLGFELAGASDGEALDWTVDFYAPASDYAAFGPDLGDSIETFDWDDPYLETVGTDSDSTSALYAFGADGAVDPLLAPKLDVETFESGWPGTDTRTIDLVGASVTSALYDGGQAEKFDWVVDYLLLLDDGNLVTGQAFDDHETGWNADVPPTFGAAAAPYMSASGALDVETFESFMPELVCSVDPDADVLVYPNNGYPNGLGVYISAPLGSLPTGILSGVRYFVEVLNPSSFQLRDSSGAVAIGSAGGGTVTVTPDPAIYWTRRATL